VTPMNIDPIVEEIHRIRRRQAKRLGNDTVAMLRDLQERERAHSSRLVPCPGVPPPRRAPNGARRVPANPGVS